MSGFVGLHREAKDQVETCLAMPLRSRFKGLENEHGPIEGIIYFITAESGSEAWVKVGFTRSDPVRRLKSLQTGCPMQLRVYGAMLGCRAQEQEIHDVLRDHRARGEWFWLDSYPRKIIRNCLMACATGSAS